MVTIVLTVVAWGLFENPANGQQITGQVSMEGRLFTQDALRDNLYPTNVSIAIEPEFYQELNDGRQSLTVVPFLRWDEHDSERTHWDVRELDWEYFARDWELRAGVRKVFWGVTESNHLVDVINQTDLVEDLDSEAKLGQPMVNLAIIQPWGTLDLYALMGFRQRRFFGAGGRPGIPFPFNSDGAKIDGGNFGWAMRWAYTAGPMDIGVSQFHGTARDPRFFIGDQPIVIADFIRSPFPSIDTQDPMIVPGYEVIDQLGVDAQLTMNGWLLKFEGINRWGQGSRFAAMTGGLEYTLGNLRSSGLDLGLLVEYSYDDRGIEALTPLEDDVFLGGRLAFNDVQTTEVLAGTVLDRTSKASFLFVEASRRLGERSTLDVRIRSFVGVPPDDVFLYGIRNDDYLQASWTLYF
ncbi:MAG: hypothetical protein CL484_14330 [Acidobacteria bacterium]|nr:hypothetical protein [Acidobacteriota bacterium]